MESKPLFTPEQERRITRSYTYRKLRALMWLFHPFWNIPIVNVGATFWFGILDEGVRSTLKPRYGLLTFHYLNDGMHPSLWHTWKQITSPRTGIYIGRAPKSAIEAEWVERNHRNLPKYRVD